MIGTTINHPVAAQTRSSAVVEPAQMTPKVTLGSASPRRADLLRSLGVDFDVEVVELDEHAFIDELERDPRVLAETIARAKFAAFPANGTDRLLLTADTLVACNGTVMGKPTTNRRLAAMLASMSGSQSRDRHRRLYWTSRRRRLRLRWSRQLSSFDPSPSRRSNVMSQRALVWTRLAGSRCKPKPNRSSAQWAAVGQTLSGCLFVSYPCC